jgi:predicted nucleotidyltransferase
MFNVKEIGIFGSFVRGEQKDTSDLDLLIDFEVPIGLIRYVGLQNYFERQGRGAGGSGHKVGPQTDDRWTY